MAFRTNYLYIDGSIHIQLNSSVGFFTYNNTDGIIFANPNNTIGLTTASEGNYSSSSSRVWYKQTGGTSGSHNFGINGQTLLFCASSSKIGIGTINPLSTLDVSGNFRFLNKAFFTYPGDWSVNGSGSRTFTFAIANYKMCYFKTTYHYCKTGNGTVASFCEWRTVFYSNDGSTVQGLSDTKVLSAGSFITNISLATTLNANVVTVTISNSDATATLNGCIMIEFDSYYSLPSTVTFN